MSFWKENDEEEESEKKNSQLLSVSIVKRTVKNVDSITRRAQNA